MHGFEQQLVEFLSHLFNSIGWPGVVGIMVLESANIPIPSEVTMPLAGWMLVLEHGGSQLDALFWGGLYGAIGCTVGSLLSYGLGAWGGRPFLDKYGRYIMVNPSDLKHADHWFHRWGDWVAFLSRLLPIVRTFISFPAGVSRVNLFRFTALTFLGSFVWAAALTFGGYMFGSRWEVLREIMRPFDIPIAVILVGGLLFYLWHHIRRGRAAWTPTAEE